MVSRRPIHEGWLSVPGSFGCCQRRSSSPPRASPATSETIACVRVLVVSSGTLGAATTVTMATTIKAVTQPATYALSFFVPSGPVTRRRAARTDHGWTARKKASSASVSTEARSTTARFLVVDKRVPGQAEDAFGDLVALDLRRPACDGQRPVHQHHRPGHRAGALEVGRLRTGQVGEDLRALVGELGQQQLRHVALRAGTATRDRP